MDAVWVDELGPLVENAGPWSRPTPRVLAGRYCALEPLDIDTQAEELFEQMYLADPQQRQWKYLAGMGPFADVQAYVDGWRAFDQAVDNLTFAVRMADTGKLTGKLTGQLSLLRIQPKLGSIEVGFVRFPPQMQGTAASTEAQFLLADFIFTDCGYRRYEWKCNDKNEASMKAARRLGFTFEGTFRQYSVDHGRNRDTAWFSIIDSEWPALRAGYERWLDPRNFDATGRQKQRLQQLFSK